MHHVTESRVSSLLDRLVDAGAPGVLARLEKDDRCWTAARGVARLGAPDPVAPDGWFRIGSLTKAFTATVLFQLTAENVLQLEDTVEDWLPSTVPSGERITLQHLVSQTSGLYNYTDDLTDNAAIVDDRDRAWTPQAIVAAAVAREPLFPPGTARSYSSTNYILLGMVIEAATGNSYEDEVERRILRPLGMLRTLMPRQAPAIPEPHAHGYLTVAGEPVDVATFNASHAWAAAGSCPPLRIQPQRPTAATGHTRNCQGRHRRASRHSGWDVASDTEWPGPICRHSGHRPMPS